MFLYFCIFVFLYLFSTYFWHLWGLLELQRAESGCFSGALGPWGSAMSHVLSRPGACGPFPDQGSNPCPLNCRQILNCSTTTKFKLRMSVNLGSPQETFWNPVVISEFSQSVQSPSSHWSLGLQLSSKGSLRPQIQRRKRQWGRKSGQSDE